MGKQAQQAKFKAAAKKCKGKPGYRACMSRELRKKQNDQEVDIIVSRIGRDIRGRMGFPRAET